MVLMVAWRRVQDESMSPGGSPEAQRAAQSVMLQAVRQSVAVLQLRTVAPARRQPAVRRARAAGFLQVLSLKL